MRLKGENNTLLVIDKYLQIQTWHKEIIQYFPRDWKNSSYLSGYDVNAVDNSRIDGQFTK